MNAMVIRPPTPVLAWANNSVEDQLFRKILVICFLFFFTTSLTVSLILPTPEVSREELEQLPPRMARLIREQKPLPPPPPPQTKVEEELPKPPEPEAEKKAEPKPEPKPVEKAPEAPKPETVQKAREKAMSSGLLRLRDQLAALRDIETVSDLKTQTNLSTGGAEAGNSRSLLTRKGGSGSGGITTSAVSHSGAGQVASRQVTQVESAAVEDEKREARKRRTRERTLEDIKFVFDQMKGRFYTLYRRAQREDAGLQGRVVFRLVIQPDGSVSHAEVVSSTLNHPDLERKLVARIKLINFGKADVGVWDNTYHIDFLPS